MSAEMVREVATLGLSDAEALFAVVVHRDPALGTVRTKIVNMAPGLSQQHQDAMYAHLCRIAETLKAASLEKSSAG